MLRAIAILSLGRIVADTNSPTLRRWELGSTLRRIRDSQGKTIEQVSHDLSEQFGVGFSAAKISRLETAKRGVNPRDVRDLCDYYGVDPAERDRLIELAKASREHNRWQGLGESYATYVALESIAARARTYESMFIPGLLQVPAYAEVVESLALPEFDIELPPQSRVADRVALRAERQKRLHSAEPLVLHAVLDENVVRRPVGPPAVMAAQLNHLVEVSAQPNITIQVMPITIGLYPGSEASGLTLLDFPTGETMPDDVCYVEGILGAFWAERETDLRRINQVYSYLADTALSPDDTRGFLTQILRERSK